MAHLLTAENILAEMRDHPVLISNMVEPPSKHTTSASQTGFGAYQKF